MTRTVSPKTSTVAVLLAVSLLLVLPTQLLGRRVGRAHMGVTGSYSDRHAMKQLGTSSEGKKTGTVAANDHAYGQEQQRTMMAHWRRRVGLDTVQIAGSSLPDCSHACGSCSPCRLVMVSFVCASLEEAETCPMAYKCMCHSKSYPVP